MRVAKRKRSSVMNAVHLDVLFNGNKSNNNEQYLFEFLSSAKSSDHIVEPSDDQEHNVMIGVGSISSGM